MATRSTNPHRVDPYKNFKFRVKIGGRIVAGVARVSGLTGATKVADEREARGRASGRKLPGRRKYPNLTLKRGMTRDAEFQRWAAGMSAARKDVVIEMFDEAGRLARSYRVHRGWVSKYEASNLKASANEAGIESLTLENEGLELMRPRG